VAVHAYWSTCAYTRVCTELLAERHLPGRECGITADLIEPATRRVYNNGRSRLRRRSTARLAQSARRDLSQLLSSHALLSLNVSQKLTFMTSVFIKIVFTIP